MTALLVKSTLAMFGALLMVMAARRSRASLRHLILAALFVFLLLLPAVQSVAPALKIPVSAATTALALGPADLQAIATQNGEVAAAPSTTPTTNWGTIIARVYLGVAALLLAWLAIGMLRLRFLANEAEVWLDGTARMNEIAHAANIRRAALVVLSRDVAVPMTFGFRRSTIVVPYAAREWSDDELTRALRHELEHVRREDWLLQLAARAACAIYWPHPLVWASWRRFCLEAERACDDAVIGVSEPSAYAGQLVSLARNLRGLSTVPALGMASRSKLAVRVDAILDPRQRRGPHGELSSVIVLALLLVLLVCVAPARLIAAATQFNPDPDIDFNVDLDHSIGETLVRVAKSGDVDRMKELLDQGVNVNTVAAGDGTALIGAARSGQLKMVEFLLDENANPNVVARGDGSPLIAAAEAGHVEIAELLLNAGAERDEIVAGDENPLMRAAWNGHADVVRLLLDRGADANAQTWADGELRTPLLLARRGGSVEIERMLIAAGARE
jgi:bla regulator protein BlaR1